jgi:hypothetical protein
LSSAGEAGPGLPGRSLVVASAPAVKISALPARHARNRGCTRARQDWALGIRGVSSAGATAAVAADLPLASGEDGSVPHRRRAAGGG